MRVYTTVSYLGGAFFGGEEVLQDKNFDYKRNIFSWYKSLLQKCF